MMEYETTRMPPGQFMKATTKKERKSAADFDENNDEVEALPAIVAACSTA